MTKTTKTRIAQLVLGMFFALCGYLLAGCDGSGGASGFTDSPACSSPSAIHVVSLDQHFTSAAEESSYIEARALQLCEGWSAGVHFPTNPATGATCSQQLMTMGLLQPQAAVECEHAMTTAECLDVQHDFVDSAGVKHAFAAGPDSQGFYEIGGFGLLLDPTKNATICTPIGAGEICLNGC